MKIGFAGDWHGNINAVNRALKIFASNDVSTVAQVGDYGFAGHEAGTLYNDLVQKIAESLDITVYVTPGNHEDYDYLAFLRDWDATWGHVRDNIYVAPRGLRWEWGGRSFVSLGGAASVDRAWRLGAERAQPGMSTRRLWWPEEAVTDEDVQKVARGGFAEIMITHEAPIIPEIRMRIKGNSHGFAEEDIAYSDQIAAKVHRAAHSVMPTILFHGHHHFAHDSTKLWASHDTGYMSTRDIVGTSRIIGLNLESEPGALAILDTDDMSVVVL